jgi:hypothetical protein
MATTANVIYTRQSPCKKPKQCGCPACLGLACLDRPRFFAGQLLTEEELNGEQAYLLAKNRLHNRYLHGPGVVCGLEVTCSDCEGQVNISTGYAIDPCGNDIIVCEPTSFPLLDAISKCCQRSARKQDDCDPYQPPPAKGCEDVEQTWCVAIEYVEQQARPVTPLKPQKTTGCGCGSGSHNGKSNGPSNACGCGKPPGQCSCASQASTSPASSATAVSCEPTRIRETYCFSVLEEPESCKNLLKQWKRGDNDAVNVLASYLQLIPEDSLLGQIIACWTCAFQILSSTAKNDDWQILMLAAEQKLDDHVTVEQLHAALCRLRQAVIDLFQAAPHSVRCQLLEKLGHIDCPGPQDPAPGLPGYKKQVAPIIRNLLTAVVQYLLDCVCEAFLPPCSPDPLDNRVILACVTIKDGKILRICNFGCRSYAGAFPSLYYWLSAIPIASIIKMALELLCCGPDLPLYTYLDRLDPKREKRVALVDNNFGGARILAARAVEWLDKVTFKKFRDAVAPGFEDVVGLNNHLGLDVANVEPAMAEAHVTAHFREIRSDAEMTAAPSARISVARPGDQVLAYVKDGKVVGFAAYTSEERLRDKEAEIDRTLAEMKALRDELRGHR